MNYALCDKNMKFDTTLVGSIAKHFKVSATAKMSCEGSHLDVKMAAHFQIIYEYLFVKRIYVFQIYFNSKSF